MKICQLFRPAVETVGEHAGKWFVGTITVLEGYDNYGALYADGRVGPMLGPVGYSDNSMYYFETEADAHAKAREYYNSFGKPYPYSIDSVDTELNIDIESEVMEF